MRRVLRPSRFVLICAAIAIAALPSLRREFAWHLRALATAIPRWPESDYAKFVVGRDTTPGTTNESAAQQLDRWPRDLQLRLAIVGEQLYAPEDIQRRAMQEALRLAPRDPVVRTLAALQAYQSNRIVFLREESFVRRRDPNKYRWMPKDFHEQLLTTRQVPKVLPAFDAWAAAEPGNAAPDVFASYILFGAKRDEEAFRRVQTAARKPYFTLHEQDLVSARVHSLRLRGLPAADAEAVGVLLMRFYAKFRDFARIMTASGWNRYDDGNQSGAIPYWLTLGRIGTLMASHERESLITRMVGGAIQSIGYSPIYKKLYKPKPTLDGKVDVPKQLIVPGDAYAAFVANRGKEAARQIRGELVSNVQLINHFRALIGGSLLEDPVGRHYVLADLARRIAIIAMPALLLVALLWLFAAMIRQPDQPPLSRVWSTTLLILGIFLPICIVGFILISQTLGFFSTNPFEAIIEGLFGLGTETARSEIHFFDLPGLALVFIIAGPILLLCWLTIAAGWVRWKRKVSFRSALAGGMRQILPAAAVFLAIVWVAGAALTAHEGNIYAKYKARGRQVGELRMLEEVHAERSKK